MSLGVHRWRELEKKNYWNLGLKYSDAKLGERVKNLPNQQRVSSSKMLGLFEIFWRKEVHASGMTMHSQLGWIC